MKYGPQHGWFFCFLVLFLQVKCHVEILPWKILPHRVSNSKNNYIKINLPRECRDLDQVLEVESYMISILEEDEGMTMDRFVLINPDRGMNFFQLWWGVEQYKFAAGCELVFPVSGGKKAYEIKLGKFLNGFSAKTISNVNLVENQSLRVNVEYKGFPYANPKNSKERGENAWHRPLQLTTSVEESSLKGSYERCKIE